MALRERGEGVSGVHCCETFKHLRDARFRLAFERQRVTMLNAPP